MAIGVPDNFSYGGKKANFDRDQFVTLAEMRAYPSDFLDEGHISYCKQDRKHYTWTGTEWKEFKSEVVDNLTTDSSDTALSAAMGKKLNDSIEQLKEYREVSIDFGKNEESITIAIMQPSIISEVKKVNVQKLSLSYGGKVQQEYESGEVDLGDSDYLVLDIKRITEIETAVVGLTLKGK
jgi:hypothetical protein